MDKTEIISLVKDRLRHKVNHLERLINETRASNNETKSSMGDKYETTREMVQQEINNLQVQLNDVLKQLDSLKLIHTKPSLKVEKGALIKTGNGMFYIAVSLGELLLKGQKIFVISTESPLAKAMMGLHESQEFTLNQSGHTVLNIW